jgi:hypothetical protein
VSALRPSRLVAVALALASLLGAAGCTTNNYNCNVKDACRVPGAGPEH